MKTTHPGGLLAATLLLALALPLSSCGILDSSDERPDQARIVVEGTSEVPLRLVISTNFTATFNAETGQYDVSLATFEEFELSLPFERTVGLPTDRFLARLVNPDDVETADVRMRVLFDGAVAYDQQAQLRDAQIEFLHLFF